MKIVDDYPGNSKSNNTDASVRTGQAPEALNPDVKGMSDYTNSVFKTTGVGSITDAIGNSLYGINHRQTPGAIPLNKDFFGLTFFTRPDLNLTSDNIKAIRQLAPLLTLEKNSIPRIIRCLLDNRIGTSQNETGTSDLVDNQQAFIPMLTNHLLSISGWPDIVAPTFTSQEGVFKEAFSLIDGVVLNYSTYDVQANFRNIPGDPITLLFLMWLHYASNVFQGNIIPYVDNLIMNKVDYQTRIYRLILDSSKSYVKKIAACGAAFPLSSPIGAAFNYEHNTPISDSNHQISIPFRCSGFMAQDDILIKEFNDTAAMFNKTMAKEATEIEGKIARLLNSKSSVTPESYDKARFNSNYVKIAINELGIFNNRGYPHINLNTYELGWYIDIDTYNSVFAKK